MLKFVIPQPGLATVNLHQTGAATSSNASGVVAKCVDLRKYPDAQTRKYHNKTRQNLCKH